MEMWRWAVPTAELQGPLLAAAIIGAMFLLLGIGVWIGLALLGVGLVMTLMLDAHAGEAMATTILGRSRVDADLAAAVHLDGDPFRSRIHNYSLRPGVVDAPLPGRLMQVNVVGPSSRPLWLWRRPARR
jgi:hypothetical protein